MDIEHRDKVAEVEQCTYQWRRQSDVLNSGETGLVVVRHDAILKQLLYTKIKSKILLGPGLPLDIKKNGINTDTFVNKLLGPGLPLDTISFICSLFFATTRSHDRLVPFPGAAAPLPKGRMLSKSGA